MKKDLDNLWEQVNKTTGEDQKRSFVQYCCMVVELKEGVSLTEEEAVYEIVRAIEFENLTDSPECSAIFDIATDIEIPRAVSYAQPIGEWDQKTADSIKQGEWKELLGAIQKARVLLKLE